MYIAALEYHKPYIIYNSESSNAEEVVLNAVKLGGHLELIDVQKVRLGEEVWSDIADRLRQSIKDLMSFDRNDLNEYHDLEMSEKDWITFLAKNLKYFQKPVLISGHSCVQVMETYNILTFFRMHPLRKSARTVVASSDENRD